MVLLLPFPSLFHPIHCFPLPIVRITFGCGRHHLPLNLLAQPRLFCRRISYDYFIDSGHFFRSNAYKHPVFVSSIRKQTSPYQSPWSSGLRLKMLLWQFCWLIFCRWTPKPFNAWRLFVLRLFGTTVEGVPFIHSRARVQVPWNLTLRHRSCLGDRSHAYSLGKITLGARCTVAQEAYLCTGTHDFEDSNLPLVLGDIEVGANAFIGARAFVLPNVSVGEGAIVGACAVVTRNVAANTTVVGNPARLIGKK